MKHEGDQQKSRGNPRSPVTEVAENGNYPVADRRTPESLRAKAAALNIPTVDYDPTLTMAIRHMDGGRARFLQLVQLAAEDGDDDARKFLVVFAELKITEQQRASLDLCCAAAGVSRVSLLKTVVGVAFEHYSDIANLVAAAAHPSIIEATVKSAKRMNSDIGAKDRQHLLSHSGFLPQARGTVVNVNASANAAAAASTQPTTAVPSFLDDVSDANVARDRVQRQLTEAVVPDRLDFLDAEVVHVGAGTIDTTEDEVGWPQ